MHRSSQGTPRATHVAGGAARSGSSWLLGAALLFVFACKKEPTQQEPTPGAASGAEVAAAPSGAAGEQAPSEPAAAAATLVGTFKGAFEAKATELYMPDTDALKKRWRGEESKDGLGAGEVTVVIAADGTVSGTATGPLGTLTLNGFAEGEQIAAALSPENEQGFTGTLVAIPSGAELNGEMNLTRFNADTLRQASFKLTKQ